MSGGEAETRARLAELSQRTVDLVATDPAGAIQVAVEAVEVARQLADDEALARNLFSLGSARLAMADYASAESDLRAALDLAQRANDSPLVIGALRALLKCGFFTRNSEAALLRGMQALRTAREYADRKLLALVHNDLGLVYGHAGDFEGALEHLLAGLRLMREEGEAQLSSLLNNVGNVYFELGDFREALHFYRSAHEAFRAEGSKRGMAITLGNIGRASLELEDHLTGLDAYRQSLSIYEQTRDITYRPPALARLGTALAALHRVEEAEREFDSALAALDEGSGREFEDEVLAAAGKFYLANGDADRAITFLSRALSILPPAEATRRVYSLHEALSTCLERKGDLKEALRYYKEFHQIRQAVSDSAITVRIHGLMLQFDVERARQQEEIFRLRNVELAKANAELKELQARLEATNRELHQISIEDSLTGLYNRRFLDLQLSVELLRARRHVRPLCVAMCDIDHFKSINDRHSHTLGDDVLRRIARIFRANVRATDIVSRFGGEEFLLVLPDTDIPGAEVLMERIRGGVADYHWAELAPGLRVTLSIGVAEFDGLKSETELLAAADERLYAAKREGRDRVLA